MCVENKNSFVSTVDYDKTIMKDAIGIQGCIHFNMRKKQNENRPRLKMYREQQCIISCKPSYKTRRTEKNNHEKFDLRIHGNI